MILPRDSTPTENLSDTKEQYLTLTWIGDLSKTMIVISNQKLYHKVLKVKRKLGHMESTSVISKVNEPI